MMKRRICFAISALAVSAAVMTGIKVSRSVSEFDFMTANVEALVEAEGDKVQGICYKEIKTAENILIAYCGTCTWIPGVTDNMDATGFCN